MSYVLYRVLFDGGGVYGPERPLEGWLGAPDPNAGLDPALDEGTGVGPRDGMLAAGPPG